MFRQEPGFAADLLRETFGLPVPGYRRASVESADLNTLTPTDRRADAVILLHDADGPVQVVVVEIQLRPDQNKRWTWPVYVSTARDQHRCPVALLVVCTDTATKKWCAADIDLGHPGLVLRPLVLGPDLVPVVADVEQAAAHPALAVLSAAAHAARPDLDTILEVLVAGLARIDSNQALGSAEMVLSVLPAAARSHWEKLMSLQTHQFQSEYAQRLRAEGRVEAEAEMVLAVLDARGIRVPDDARARITECTDQRQLMVWGRRAATARTIADLFD